MKWLVCVCLLLLAGCQVTSKAPAREEVYRARAVSTLNSADLDVDGDVDLADYSGLQTQFTGPGQPGTTTLTLSFMGPWEAEAPVCVNLTLQGGDLVSGGQFFLRYPRHILRFIGAAPGDWTRFSDAGGCPGDGTSAWALEIRQYESVDPHDSLKGTIDYMVGIQLGGQPATAGRMLTLQFEVLNPGMAWVDFDPAHWWDQPGPPVGDVPPIRLTDADGDPVMPLTLVPTGLMPVGE